MHASAYLDEDRRRHAGGGYRERLISALPVAERQLPLGGVSTAVLEGGEGHPVVLLHGPGEFGGKWLRVIPELVKTHRVIAPDLPAHGRSTVLDGRVGPEDVLSWLGALIESTCPSPPTLVGHVLGGAIAARFAVAHSNRIARLVLVDALGLARFRPSPMFALTMIAFLARPTERSYTRFMRQCSYDLDALREQMGRQWEPYAAYNLELAKGPSASVAGRLMREVGLPPIPPDHLARITAPTALVWGRQDRANRLRIAENASARYGWRLHVIEDCADDPPRDQPEAFLTALRESGINHEATHGSITRPQARPSD